MISLLGCDVCFNDTDCYVTTSTDYELYVPAKVLINSCTDIISEVSAC